MLDTTPLCSLGHKISTQTNTAIEKLKIHGRGTSVFSENTVASLGIFVCHDSCILG